MCLVIGHLWQKMTKWIRSSFHSLWVLGSSCTKVYCSFYCTWKRAFKVNRGTNVAAQNTHQPSDQIPLWYPKWCVPRARAIGCNTMKTGWLTCRIVIWVNLFSFTYLFFAVRRKRGCGEEKGWEVAKQGRRPAFSFSPCSYLLKHFAKSKRWITVLFLEADATLFEPAVSWYHFAG